MRVELLFWDGCPSHPKALAELREAMVDVALDPSTVVVREVETQSDAALERFVGSPTIRIDGLDVQPPGEEPVGLTCRVYHRRDGRMSPTPDPADVRDALLAARTATTERKQMTAIGDHALTFALPDTEGTMHELGKADRSS